MNTDFSTAHRAHGIAINLASLRRLLFYAYYLSNQAHAHVAAQDYHSAIGTLTGLDTVLGDAKALYRAALALHCSPYLSGERLPMKFTQRRSS